MTGVGKGSNSGTWTIRPYVYIYIYIYIHVYLGYMIIVMQLNIVKYMVIILIRIIIRFYSFISHCRFHPRTGATTQEWLEARMTKLRAKTR